MASRLFITRAVASTTRSVSLLRCTTTGVGTSIIKPSILLRGFSSINISFNSQIATDIQHYSTNNKLQCRMFASKKKKKGGGGGGGSNSNNNKSDNKILVHICYSEWDKDDDDLLDKPIKVSSSKCNTIDQFIEQIEEKNDEYYFENRNNLSIYDSKSNEWVPLTNIEQINKENSAGKKVYILDAVEDDDDDDDYGAEYDPENDDEYDNEFDNETELRNTIIELHTKFKNDGWVRSTSDDNNNDTLTKNNITRTTTSLILEEANNNNKVLQDMLLNHIGALNHIAQCIHYDFLWVANIDEDEDNDEDNDNNETKYEDAEFKEK